MKNLSILSMIICWAIYTDAQSCDYTYLPVSPCEEGISLSVTGPQSGSTYTWDLDNDGSTDLSGNTIFYTFPSVGVFPVSLYENGTICHTENVETVLGKLIEAKAKDTPG